MASDDLPDMTAAELALGLLDDSERAAALRRLASEPGFAAEVERWRDWLGALFADWPAVTAPDAVAARVEASLDAPRGVPAANDNAGGVARWRGLAMAASIAACLLLAVTTLLMLRPAPAPIRIPVRVPVTAPAPLLAAIVPTGKGAPIAAAYDPASATVRIAGGVDVPAGHSAQLWAIHGADAPRSLGVIPAGPARVIVPAAVRPALAAETVLAISIEPAGGSPTGLPTGPVVATGKLSG
jgi:anti-sigma-K factor RskA